MLELRSLSVADYVRWGSAEFEFRPGVSFIHGVNRSGKSLLFRAPRLAIYGAGLGKRHSESSKIPAGAKIELEFANSGKRWKIKASPKSVQLFENGKSLSLSGKKSGLAKLGEVQPLSLRLFDSSVYLSANSRHFLQHASATEASEWLANLFRVDAVYDPLLEKAKADLSKANKAAVQLSVVRGLIRDARAQFVKSGEEFDSSTRSKQIKWLDEKLSAFSVSLSQERDRLSMLVELLPVLEQRDNLPKLGGRKPSGNLDELNGELHRLEETERKLIAYKSAVEAQKEFADKRAKLEARLSKLLENAPTFWDDLAQAEGVAQELGRMFGLLQDKEADWVSQEAERMFAQRNPIDIKATPGALRSAKESALQAEKRLAILQDRLKQIDSRPSGACPTCGQKASKSHNTKERRELKPEIKRAESALRVARHQAKAISMHLGWTQRTNPRNERALVGSAIKGVTEDIAILREIEEVRSAIDHLPAGKLPPRPTYNGSLRDIRAAIAQIEEDIVEIEKYRQLKRRHQDVAKALARLEVGEDVTAKSVRADRDKVKAGIARLESEVLRLTTKVATLKQADKSLTEAEKQEAELAPIVGHKAELEALVEAFGKTGLRLRRLETIAAAFEDALNEAVPLIWPEHFRFTVFTGMKGVSIRLRRDGSESDLSNLSGSEEQAWKMLCAYALSRILPPELRCDTIILDEIESNMDERSRERFSKRLMPVMIESFPKVVIVSPQNRSHLPVSVDHHYEIVSDKDLKSKLLERRV